MECGGGDWPENVWSCRKRVIDELIRGRQLTTQLEQIINQSPPGVDAKTLVVNILESLNGSISMLMNHHHISSLTKSQDSSTLSCKASTLRRPGGGGGDPTPSNKRRRISETRREETSTLFDDGHSWRKYGQKIILNAKHPRNYFRCTHKYDQGCQACKQVQKTEDDPPKYVTTYYGRHICKPILKPPEIILDDSFDDHHVNNKDSSSILLSFASHNTSFHPLLYNSQAKKQTNEEEEEVEVAVKDEDEELQGGLLCQNKQPQPTSSSSSSSIVCADYFVQAADLQTFDHGVHSCTPSPNSLEMDMLAVPLDFGDVFEFGF